MNFGTRLKLLSSLFGRCFQEAIGEDINHQHFITLISEKLPQRVLYQLYMLKAQDEEWIVSKLRHLLGKHISAMEMANLEFSQAPTQSKHYPSLGQNDHPR